MFEGSFIIRTDLDTRGLAVKVLSALCWHVDVVVTVTDRVVT